MFWWCLRNQKFVILERKQENKMARVDEIDGKFYEELEMLINKYSKENNSDTPDYILANYLVNCLSVFEEAVLQREYWYGRGKVAVSPPIEK
jgi:hypothetical protein